MQVKMENIVSILFKVYLVGCLFFGANSVYIGVEMLILQKTTRKNVFFQHPKMKNWLIQRVVYWPYYLFVKTNPIVLFSELFFSRYGDQGHIYYGTTGLKNFLNDLFKGKNRYKNFKVFTTTTSLSSSFIRKMKSEYPGKKFPKYASVLLAKYSECYLFKSSLASDERLLGSSASRFELDGCQRLTKDEVLAALNEMNPSMSHSLIEKLN